jgi:hypothetical protein
VLAKIPAFVAVLGLAWTGRTLAPAQAVEDSQPLTGKTARTLLVFALVLAVPFTTDKLRPLRIVRAPWDHVDDEQGQTAAATTTPTASVGEIVLPASKNEGTPSSQLPAEPREALDPAVLAKVAGSRPIDDPSGHALDAFYAQLSRTMLREHGAVTRILHYGDSLLAGDYISGAMRRRMQADFGDAGHGFILLAGPWQWYFHNDVRHETTGKWSSSRTTGPLAADGLYGLGGVSFHTKDVAFATFATAERGAFGRNVSRFDVHYLEQPGGGDFELRVEGREPLRVSTGGATKVSRLASLQVPDGSARMVLRTFGKGDVRLFGVALERDVPGIVYDALGVMGARMQSWASMPKEHWTEQFALRKPALVILQYGTNESVAGEVDEQEYRDCIGTLIETIHAAAPNCSLLVMSPLDRAAKGKDGELRTLGVIKKLVNIQHEAAVAHGAAFWNTYEAMGGSGSMARWVKWKLASDDLTHPMPEGAEVITNLFFKALMVGYQVWASNHAEAPMLDGGVFDAGKHQ